jgi:hypothetical protein
MEWAEPEQDDRMPQQSVAPLRRLRERRELSRGQRLHITMAPTIEISRRRMVTRMISAPLSEGCECHDSRDPPDEAVELP